MRIQSLHIGMRVRHPQYGEGTVKSLSELAAEVRFIDGVRTVEPEASGLTSAEPTATVTGLDVPLTQFVEEGVERVLKRMGWEKADEIINELGTRWHKGKLVLHPSDPTLATKEVPIEVFFHKIIGMRNQFRVLEQKINAHPQMNDAEKIELQQYISRCYGSMTTFNLLFKEKAGQFTSKSE